MFVTIVPLVIAKKSVCNSCTCCPKERVQVVMVRPPRTRGRIRHCVCLPRPLRRHGTDGPQHDEAAVLLHDLTVSEVTSRGKVSASRAKQCANSFCPLTSSAVPSRSWMLLGFGQKHRIRKRVVAGIDAVCVSLKLRNCVTRKHLREVLAILLHSVSIGRTCHRVLDSRGQHL